MVYPDISSIVYVSYILLTITTCLQIYAMFVSDLDNFVVSVNYL